VFSWDLYVTIAVWMFHKFFVKTRRSLSQDKISKLINYVFPCSYLLTSPPEALDWLHEVYPQDKFYFWEFMPQIQKDEVAVYELMVILWEWQIKDQVRKHFFLFINIFDCEYLLVVQGIALVKKDYSTQIILFVWINMIPWRVVTIRLSSRTVPSREVPGSPGTGQKRT
jgi:hypothetical protein